MKYCSKCGQQLPDQAIFCTNCGNSVSEPDAAQSQSQPQYQPQYQPQFQPQPQPYPNPYTNPYYDRVSVGLCVLAAFIPLFGFIYWPLKHRETPRKARACGITAIVSWAVSFCFGFILGILGSLYML